MNAQIRYDSVPAVTSPLTKFRDAVKAVGNEPTREDLQRLIVLARDLDLTDYDTGEDLANVSAALEAFELANRLEEGDLPTVKAPDPLAPGDECHFVAPVRFGRRRSDQYGHVVLTSGWLKFRGTLDVSVAWGEVAAVQRAGREIVVSLEESRRLLRFSCHSLAEAGRGIVIAQYLARAARSHTVDSNTASQHAAL